MEEKILTHGIKLKDKIGYALGDAGGLLTFSLIGAFQNKFYTDALGISQSYISRLEKRIIGKLKDELTQLNG